MINITNTIKNKNPLDRIKNKNAMIENKIEILVIVLGDMESLTKSIEVGVAILYNKSIRQLFFIAPLLTYLFINKFLIVLNLINI